MARVAKGFRYGEYLSLTTRAKTDVERMSPTARKAYLRRQLGYVEAQIGAVLNRLTEEEGWQEPPDWSGQSLDEERWASLSSLGYLVAERDALVDAINGLL